MKKLIKTIYLHDLAPILLVLGSLAMSNDIGTVKSVNEANSYYCDSLNIEEPTEKKPVTQIPLQGLSTASRSWYLVYNGHNTPGVQGGLDYSKFNAYYVGNTSEKVIYLTFDDGYENGYTSKILDTLKEKGVKACFFCTLPYMKKSPELVKRMKTEGHVVANHSVSHVACSGLGEDKLKAELAGVEEEYRKITGEELDKFFRPPMGEYSEMSLAIANNLGYKNIFWSFAYKDWVVEEQPGAQVAYDTVMSKYHNGEIMLLHAVSSSNTEALGKIIDSLKEQGYTFASLYELP